jgi:hypothetical protein
MPINTSVYSLAGGKITGQELRITDCLNLDMHFQNLRMFNQATLKGEFVLKVIDLSIFKSLYNKFQFTGKSNKIHTS